MDQTRTQQSRYGAAGIPGAAPLVPLADVPKGIAMRAAGAVGRWLKSAAAVFGVLYAVGWVALVVGIPMVSRLTWRPPMISNTINRTRGAELMRPFALPRDASITPDEAGREFFSLGPAPERAPSGGFAYRAIPDRPDVPWRNTAFTLPVFSVGADNAYEGPERSKIIAAAARGLSRADIAALRVYGTAGAWATFDRVARAPKIDFVAGRLQLPFAPDATPYAMPIAAFGATKEFAYAATARAAWHLAEGRKDSAEAALRAVVSVGLQLVDNGSFLLDELIGDVIVGIGREGLKQLYLSTGDPRLSQILDIEARAKKLASTSAAMPWSHDASLEESQQGVMAFATGPGATMPQRMEALMSIPRFACTSTRQLLSGPSPEARAAFDAVRRDYAGVPGQRAEIDLIESQLSQPIAGAGLGIPESADRLTSLVSRVYFNPRLGTCAVISLTGTW